MIIPTIIEDTREIKPLSFESLPIRGAKSLPTIRKKLDEGDYSILGMEDVVFIERKSIADLYGTLLQGRERFVRELDRVAEKGYKHRYILIENQPSGLANYIDTERQPKNGKATYDAIINSLFSMGHKYTIRVKFCKSRADMAEFIARETLEIVNKIKGE